jgi:hypothetical protein
MATRSPVPAKDPIERAYRVSEVWIRYLLEERTSPSIPLHPSYYLAKEKIEEIAQSTMVTEHPCISNWLSARRSDLTPETAPQLFCGVASLAASNADSEEEQGDDDSFEDAGPAEKE